jgi:hypothetical protein
VWESFVVNSGFRLSSLLGEEFLSAPIHSPLSGLLIGPSTLAIIIVAQKEETAMKMCWC